MPKSKNFCHQTFSVEFDGMFYTCADLVITRSSKDEMERAIDVHVETLPVWSGQIKRITDYGR